MEETGWYKEMVIPGQTSLKNSRLKCDIDLIYVSRIECDVARLEADVARLEAENAELQRELYATCKKD